MSKCKCGNQARPGQRTCPECHATYMREWRQRKPVLSRMEMEDGQIEEILEAASCIEGDIIKLDGLDGAVVGIADGFNFEGEVLAYSTAKIVNILMERDGMDYDEAVEFFDFNIRGLGVPGAPVFIRD